MGQLAVTVAADGAHVFFATGTALYSVPSDGSAAATKVVPNLAGVSVLALDADNVYWVGGGGDLSSCAKTGCASPTTLATKLAGPAYMAVVGGNVYFAARGANAEAKRCATTGCMSDGPLVLAREGKGMGGFAVDATSIYWQAAADGSLKKTLN